MDIPLGGQLPLDRGLWQQLSTLQARRPPQLPPPACAAAAGLAPCPSHLPARAALPLMRSFPSPLFQTAQNLNLFNTGLSGFVPPQMSELSTLQFLSLGRNKLEGARRALLLIPHPRRRLQLRQGPAYASLRMLVCQPPRPRPFPLPVPPQACCPTSGPTWLCSKGWTFLTTRSAATCPPPGLSWPTCRSAAWGSWQRLGPA